MILLISSSLSIKSLFIHSFIIPLIASIEPIVIYLITSSLSYFLEFEVGLAMFLTNKLNNFSFYIGALCLLNTK